MRRFLSLLLAATFANACTSTNQVPAQGLGGIHAPRFEEGVVYAEDGEAIRVDPNTHIRFHRTDGSWTPWRDARELWVAKDGVVVRGKIDLCDESTSVAATDLAPELLSALRATEPHPGALAMDGAIVRVQDKSVCAWLRSAFAVAGKPTGTWSVLNGAGIEVQLPGKEVLAYLDRGVATLDGIRWGDLTGAELENFSGGKSLAGTIAVSAAVVALLPLAMVARRAPNIPVGAIARVGAEVGVRAADAAITASAKESASAQGLETTDTLRGNGYDLPDAQDATPLFDGVARRRSIARFGAGLDAGSAFNGASPWSSSAIAAVRFVDYFELGAGVRWLGRGSGADLAKIFRVGFHAELDPHRRFAIPLLFDLGGGGDVRFTFRATFGMRVRVTDVLWVGVNPLNPTWVAYAPTAGARSNWSFPTSIETSFLF